MPADYEFVEVSQLLGCVAMKAQVVEDDQVREEKCEEGAIHGGVHFNLGHGPEEIVGAEGAGDVPGHVGGAAERPSYETLVLSRWAHQRDV